jgi:hypothetical protein
MDATLAPIELDLAVAQLPEELGVSKPTLYEWFRACGITPYKIPGEGNNSYVTQSDLQTLRTYQASGAAPARTLAVTPDSPVLQMDSIFLVERTVAAIAPLLPQPAAQPQETRRDQVALIREIAETLLLLAKQGVKLSSSEVKTLIGCAPTGNRFTRYGFMFAQCGRQGAQNCWEITKM